MLAASGLEGKRAGVGGAIFQVNELWWMTFYTKVPSRFVNTPGLKLEISFEAPAAVARLAL